MSVSRSVPLRLCRSFSTTSSCRNADTPAVPSPPRRKGRTPRVDPKTQSLLPPEKLRALVSLYHQSENVITMQNLGQRIDEAFKHPVSITGAVSYKSLGDFLKEQRGSLRMTPWNLEAKVASQNKESTSLQKTESDSSWSSRIARRERQVIDALCGTETIPNGPALPGYGTLVEARKREQEKLNGEAV